MKAYKMGPTIKSIMLQQRGQIVQLIPCRESVKVLVPCGGGILYWYW